MTFGYATAEFEVTSERLGVYRPEEHIEYVELIITRCAAGYLADIWSIVIQRDTQTTQMQDSMTHVYVVLSSESSLKSTMKLV